MANVAVQKKENGETAAVARRDWEPFRLMRDMLRWDPFREMAPALSVEIPSYSPAFEVKETKESFVFKADVPGTKEPDVEVNVAGNRLTISGSAKRRRRTRVSASTRTSVLSAASRARSRCPTAGPRARQGRVQERRVDGRRTKAAAAVAKQIPVRRATSRRPDGCEWEDPHEGFENHGAGTSRSEATTTTWPRPRAGCGIATSAAFRWSMPRARSRGW